MVSSLTWTLPPTQKASKQTETKKSSPSKGKGLIKLNILAFTPEAFPKESVDSEMYVFFTLALQKGVIWHP